MEIVKGFEGEDGVWGEKWGNVQEGVRFEEGVVGGEGVCVQERCCLISESPCDARSAL